MTDSLDDRLRKAIGEVRVEEVIITSFPSDLSVLVAQIERYRECLAEAQKLYDVFRASKGWNKAADELGAARIPVGLQRRSVWLKIGEQKVITVCGFENDYTENVSPVSVTLTSGGGYVFVGSTSGIYDSGDTRGWSSRHTVTVKPDGSMTYECVDNN